MRNNDFAKAAEAFKKKWLLAQLSFQPNDVMMASYVFEQAGDKEAEKIRQDSLKISHVNSNKPTEIQTGCKTDEEPTALVATWLK